MASYIRSIRNLSRDVHLYNLSWFFIGFAYFGINAVLTNLYLLRLGWSLSLIGLILGVQQLVWAVTAIPASMIGMRFGLRNSVVIGSLIAGVSYTLFLLTAYLPGNFQVPGVFITIIMMYIGSGMVLVCGLPYLSFITCAEDRRQALAINGVMTAGASILGSIAAGFLPGWLSALTKTSLSEALPYRLSLALVPLLTFVITCIFGLMRKDEFAAVETPTARSSSPVPMLIFLFFGLIVFLQTASEGGLRSFFNVYLDQNLGVTTATIGTLFGISGLVSVFGNLIMPALVARSGSSGAFGLVSFTGAAALIFIGALPNFPAAASGYIAIGLIYAIGGAVRNVLSQEIVQPTWRSSTSAILLIGQALGWAGMAFIGGFVINHWQFGGLMYLCAASAALSTILVLAYLRWRAQRAA